MILPPHLKGKKDKGKRIHEIQAERPRPLQLISGILECESLEQRIDENVIEATLFSAGRPLSYEEIRDAIGVSKAQFDKLFKSLKKRYRETNSSLEVEKLGRKYVLQLKTNYVEYIKSLARREIPMKLLKTLALIAFHQPLKQSDLKRMIGPKVYDHIPELREFGLVRVRRDPPTKLLYTTEKFNEYFGIKAGSKDKKEIRRILAEKVGIILEEKPKVTIQTELPAGEEEVGKPEPEPGPEAKPDPVAEVEQEQEKN